MVNTKGRYLAYLLRIWQVNDAGKLVWRASLENAHTGDRHGFINLEALIAFLRDQICNGNRKSGGIQSREK